MRYTVRYLAENDDGSHSVFEQKDALSVRCYSDGSEVFNSDKVSKQSQTWAIYVVTNSSECPLRVDTADRDVHSCGHIDRANLDDPDCSEKYCPLVRARRR